METRPIVHTFNDQSKAWEYTFEFFKTKVYVPANNLPDNIINYGYDAPYLLVFEEKEMDMDAAKLYADNTGLAQIASEYASSVVFIYPTGEDGWKGATKDLWIELISKSKIHEYHKDGYAILNNRFTKQCDGYAIRGAIFRTFIFSKGASADYVATNLIDTIDGEGLWGPAVITPTACVLESLSVEPKILRKDMPIASLANSDSLNEKINEQVKDFICMPESDYIAVFNEFLKPYKRWGWVGDLSKEEDLKALGMTEEAGIANLETSKDNLGDDKETNRHEVGYLAYYNDNLFEKGAAPLVLCFHGGGDSAKHIAKVSEWYRVAKDHDFLLICVENHLNSTATEMMELIEILKDRYNIDSTRIYATGFSMGGCKSWDLYQEYPQVFAGLAPMDATFDVGRNIFDQVVEKGINEDVLVPIFYAGGEITPLPELPFQEKKCLDRMQYVFKVNKVKKALNVKIENVTEWVNPIWGIDGDRIEKIYDESRDATLTLHYFDSEDGNCYSVFGSIDNQGHECRYHTCEQAWSFISQFRRLEDGSLIS